MRDRACSILNGYVYPQQMTLCLGGRGGSSQHSSIARLYPMSNMRRRLSAGICILFYFFTYIRERKNRIDPF